MLRLLKLSQKYQYAVKNAQFFQWTRNVKPYFNLKQLFYENDLRGDVK